MNMRALTYLLFVAVLLLNPMVACDLIRYDYGAPEMQKALRGTWTVTTKSGHTSTFTIDFGRAQHASAGLVAPAAACGTRSLVSAAEACMDVTEMKLEIIVASGDEPTEATFSVVGRHFESGELRMRLGDEYLVASVSPNGDVGKSRGAQFVHTR